MGVTSLSTRPRATTATISIPVGQLPKIVALEKREVGGEAGGYLARLSREAKRSRAVDRGGDHNLRGTHSRLADAEGKDERKVDRRRRARVEIGSQRDGRSGVDQRARRRLLRSAKEEHRPRQERRNRPGCGERLDASVGD